MNSAHRKRLL